MSIPIEVQWILIWLPGLVAAVVNAIEAGHTVAAARHEGIGIRHEAVSDLILHVMLAVGLAGMAATGALALVKSIETEALVLPLLLASAAVLSAISVVIRVRRT